MRAFFNLRFALLVSSLLPQAVAAAPAVSCVPGNTVTANVVALSYPLIFNRLGATLPDAMIFALQRDVCPMNQPGCYNVGLQTLIDAATKPAGNPQGVTLREGKRPRPLVLRVNQGQCLQVRFTNLLTGTALQASGASVTLMAGVHFQGMEWAASPTDDGSYIGRNPTSLVAPGSSATYTVYAAHEGTYLLYSTGDNWTPPAGTGDGGQLQQGLFGAVNVEPAGAEWYRSQVTEQDLCLASYDGHYNASTGRCTRQNPDKPPLINYRATYPKGYPKRGLFPILSMQCIPTLPLVCASNELMYSDLTAVITGKGAGRFPVNAQDKQAPVFNPSYALPDRYEPYREFTIVYHENFQTVQAFPDVWNNGLTEAGQDEFGMNYGMAGIGSEIIANRLNTGPMKNCPSCKYEEFFLASWAVGDPAMVVDRPASTGCTAHGVCRDTKTSSNALLASPPKTCNPDSGNTCGANANCQFTHYTCDQGPAKQAFYPDDPSNVYHSYISDHTKFRVLHGGTDLHHLHHQHAHQWLHSPDTSNGDYTDSQAIGPGSAFTMEMVYNGSGNVNQTVGDSIFHCHFYPHFAGGMWSLWRVHDVFEAGTELDQDGLPVHSFTPGGGGGLVTTARALPDGEIVYGTPIPAVVPLPTLPMAPLPAKVVLRDNGTSISVCRTLAGGTTECISNREAGNPTGTWKNPGYPFFIPGLGGQRAPHPPLDFAKENPADPKSPDLDGGLPRHLIGPCPPNQSCTAAPPLNGIDFSKTLVAVKASELPEDGTQIEKVAMAFHAKRGVDSVTPEGKTTTVDSYDPTKMRPAQFLLNGLPPQAGAPYADPCVSYTLAGGAPPGLKTRFYYAADIQTDTTFNKEGWHFPQQRMITLWGDVAHTLSGQRPPEPFFFRANSGECIHYVLANLVPNVYELDDFQVRTPTDILGQHIHLVKFDVTSSDGATNGFNYEDGTLAPNEVTERIRAINAGGGLSTAGGPISLKARDIPFFGPGPGGQWMGAQATVQRWYADPLFDGPSTQPKPPAKDRTLRTVFTHDHFGPSTHQQAGLYAGLVIEPKGSLWYDNEKPGAAPFGGVDAQGNPLPGRTVPGYAGPSVRDGGPTTWQAVIQTPNANESFREFLLEIQDSTLTYEKFQLQPATPQGFCSDNGKGCTPATVAGGKPVTTACQNPQTAVCYAYGFCSDNFQPCKPATWNADAQGCQKGATCNLVRGVPGDITAATVKPWGTTPLDNLGTGNADAKNAKVELITLQNASNSFSLNYRNEPLFPRIIDPATGKPSTQGTLGDLSYAYTSQPRPWIPATGPYPPLTQDVQPGDPFTPLLRAYAGDDVQVRTLMGGQINPHNYTIQGLRWLMEPSLVDSGWRNSQVMGISEHFEEVLRLPTWVANGRADYLYMGGAAATEQAGGNWGLLRAYGATQSNLRLLPQNSNPGKNAGIAVCPIPSTGPTYTVVALTAQQALGGSLVYNARSPQITDPAAILYYNVNDLNCPTPLTDANASSCTAKSKTAAPMVLRASAGDCITVNLYNGIGTKPGAGSSWAVLPPFCNTSTTNCMPSTISAEVGLHPQLVSFDVTRGNGFNAGLNPPQTVAAGTHKTYTWYAGNIDTTVQPPKYIPIEYGAINLLPSDVVNHYQHGLYAALVVEPYRSQWSTPASGDSTTAFVTHAAQGPFREFVLLTPDGMTNPPATSQAVPLGIDGLNAINYTSEPLQTAALPQMRWCGLASTCASGTPPQAPLDVSCALASPTTPPPAGTPVALCCTAISNGNCSACAPCGPPQTPVLNACAGEPVRLRLLHPGGVNTNEVFELYGHVWAETPYMSVGPEGCIPPTTHTNLYASSVISDRHQCLGFGGYNATNDSLTDWQGSHMGHGPGNHSDILIDRAGGVNAVAGDYLFRTYPAFHFKFGFWGILRVGQCSASGQPGQSAAVTAAPVAMPPMSSAEGGGGL